MVTVWMKWTAYVICLAQNPAHSKQPVSVGGTEEVQGAEEMVGLMREEEREVGH